MPVKNRNKNAAGRFRVAVIETVKTVSPPSAKYWREGVLPVADKAYIEALPPRQDTQA